MAQEQEGYMRYWVLNLVMLVGLVGCHPTGQPYQPVDWDSQPAPPSSVVPNEPPHPDQVPATVQTLLTLHNQQREMKGRPGLELDQYLCQYAQAHAEWMASHNNLKHSDISRLMGRYSTAGENIAWNQRNEEEVVKDWMNSPGHRANILNRSFTKVGFGVAYNKNGEPYWCTCFGG
jgi:uncharacterized protein YkwD